MRIGVIGYGFIGRSIVERIEASGGLFETAFVHNRSADALAGLDPAVRLDDLGRARERRPSLIIECAHPSFTARFGAGFLEFADYMPLSVTALADDALRTALGASAKTANAHGTRMFVPCRGTAGRGRAADRGREAGSRVRITFRKHPDNIDFSDSGLDPASDRPARPSSTKARPEASRDCIRATSTRW